MKTQENLKRYSFNPISKIENIFRERKLRKEKKLLQLQLAILSGGIKRMK